MNCLSLWVFIQATNSIVHLFFFPFFLSCSSNHWGPHVKLQFHYLSFSFWALLFISAIVILLSFIFNNRDNRASRSSLLDGFDGLEEGGVRASSSYSRDISEHDNDKTIESLQDRVVFLKRVSPFCIWILLSFFLNIYLYHCFVLIDALVHWKVLFKSWLCCVLKGSTLQWQCFGWLGIFGKSMTKNY